MSAWLAKISGSIPKKLFRELSGADKVVLICLCTFYGGILASSIVYAFVAISLHFGRAMASPLGGTC